MPNSLLTSVRNHADRFFSGIGARNILVRHGESTLIDPTPLCVYQGLQPVSDVNTAMSEADSLETYSVDIGYETMVAVFGTQAAITASVSPNVLWYVDHQDGQGWRRCRTHGVAKWDVVSISFKLVRIGLFDY